MEFRLTKSEWEKQITDYHTTVLNKSLDKNEDWWFTDTSFRLRPLGFQRFREANIEFHHFECHLALKEWTGAFILGLSSLPVPFYLGITKSRETYDFYIADTEYAMMFILLDKNLFSFMKGLYDSKKL